MEQELKAVQEVKLIKTKFNIEHKIKFYCKGTIHKNGSWLDGKPCRKFLAEANERGELRCKIKCPRCGTINEAY